jgi:hypothetical protein
LKRTKVILLILGVFALSFSGGDNDPNQKALVGFLKEYLNIKYGDYEFDRFIYVAAKRQKLYMIEGDEIVKTYTISTAKNGIGNLSGSFQTPEGLHKIADKIGDGLPENTVIKAKQPTAQQVDPVKIPISTTIDIITTRVLHLKGLEENVNTGKDKDSYLRGIFIHGTHEEGLLGSPASKGCIRMGNKDIIELFNSVEVGTFVVILNN